MEFAVASLRRGSFNSHISLQGSGGMRDASKKCLRMRHCQGLLSNTIRPSEQLRVMQQLTKINLPGFLLWCGKTAKYQGPPVPVNKHKQSKWRKLGKKKITAEIISTENLVLNCDGIRSLCACEDGCDISISVLILMLIEDMISISRKCSLISWYSLTLTLCQHVLTGHNTRHGNRTKSNYVSATTT